MNPVTAYVTDLLAERLEEHRVVVWYDAERAFADLARGLPATTSRCVVIDAGASPLRARREADAVFLGLSDPERRPGHDRNLLIYVPAARARTDERKVIEFFEAYAVLGAAFGDKPAENLPALAAAAMPERAGEIERLFAEGRPTLALLDGLKSGASFPVLGQCLGTDAPIEVAAALLLDRPETAAALQGTPGATEELRRLLNGAFGFAGPAGGAPVAAWREAFVRYALLSEFAFDLLDRPLPEALAGQPVAGVEHRARIFGLCDRLRRSDDTRDAYLNLARREEDALRLREWCAGWDFLGVRDTFPFEERHYLGQVQALAGAGERAKAREILERRRASVWSHTGERAVLWKLAERCLEFLDAAQGWSDRPVAAGRPLAEHLRTYTEGEAGHWRLDRAQRLVEQGAAHCAEDDEICALVAVCRARYLETAEAMQAAFLGAVQRDGWPGEGTLRQTQTFDRSVRPAWQDGTRTAYFLVDSLRFEMGHDLKNALEKKGAVTLEWAASALPATTPCGMAALMPGADGALRLVEKDGRLVPELGGQPLPDSAARMAMLKARFGDRVTDLTLGSLLSLPVKNLRPSLKGADLLVVRTGDMDTLGEVTSLYHARRQMSGILQEIGRAVDRLVQEGWRRFVFAADHGHVLLPEVPAGEVITEPAGRWLLSKRRCRLGTQTTAAAGTVALPAAKVGIDAPAPDFVVPTGFKVFQGGEGYFHEGLSLQECVLPLLTLAVEALPEPSQGGSEVILRYRATRYTSRVVGLKVWFNSLVEPTLAVRVEAYAGGGAKAKLVGEAADCDARDPSTGLVNLSRGVETQVPIRIEDEFGGDAIEVRVIEAAATGLVLARLTLENGVME